MWREPKKNNLRLSTQCMWVGTRYTKYLHWCAFAHQTKRQTISTEKEEKWTTTMRGKKGTHMNTAIHVVAQTHIQHKNAHAQSGVLRGRADWNHCAFTYFPLLFFLYPHFGLGENFCAFSAQPTPRSPVQYIYRFVIRRHTCHKDSL